MPNDRIREWYDAVDAPAAIRDTLDAAMRYHDIQHDIRLDCEHDRLLALLVLALGDHCAPSDSRTMWAWLEELEPSLTARIATRKS